MRNSCFLFFWISLIVTGFASAQGITITGKVSNLDGELIEGANVRVNHTLLGTSTNSFGIFKLFVLSTSPMELQVQHLEYNTVTLRVNPVEAKDTLRVIMQKYVRYLDQVEIVGTKDDEPRQQVSILKVDPKAARLLPSPFNEFNKILSTLPGVTANNELSATYSVRGGNFDENLVYVNDIPIYRPFLIRAGQQEGLSFVNPDMVGNVEFSSGGWQPKWGDKLSSTLNIQYRKPTKTAGSVTLGMLGGSAHVEGVAVDKKVGYVLGIRNKSSQYLLNTLETKGEYFPNFTDIQSYVNVDLSKIDAKPNTTELGFLFSYARNRYLVRPQNRQTTFGTIDRVMRLFIAFDGTELMNYDSYQGGIKFSHTFNEKYRSFIIASALNTSEREYQDIEGGYRLCDVNNNFGSVGFNECTTIKGAGTNYEYSRNKLLATILNLESRSIYEINTRNTVEFGAGVSTEAIFDKIQEFSFIDSADFVQINHTLNSSINLNSARFTAFAQHTVLLANHQAITYGMRVNYWNLNNQFLVSPRVQYSIKPLWQRNVVFRAALGVYQQPPFYREMRDFTGGVNKDLKAQTSIHAIAGLDYDFMMWGRDFKIFTELYYKHLQNVIPYDIDNVRVRYYAHNDAIAYATGIDFRVSGEFIPGAESWFSLGLLQTKERLENNEFGYIRRPSDQRINLGIYFQDHIPNDPTIRMNLNLMFGSGLPFGPPNNEKFRNKFQGTAYKRVDIGLSKLLGYNRFNEETVIKTLWIGVEILNLLGNNNPISYTWIKDVNNQQFGVPNSLSARFFNIKVAANF
ncbi:MAG: TonB-dependent receptor [Bacteroidota bacterium]|nr:TonB-dependent receptor [Bacteroidota bacterium]